MWHPFGLFCFDLVNRTVPVFIPLGILSSNFSVIFHVHYTMLSFVQRTLSYGLRFGSEIIGLPNKPQLTRVYP